jgi:hypothetical protein
VRRRVEDWPVRGIDAGGAISAFVLVRCAASLKPRRAVQMNAA